MKDKSIRITTEAHNALVAHTEKNASKIGKLASIAIMEKLEKEKKKTK